MALKVTKVPVWAGDLRDVPGELAEVLEKLADGGASLEFVIARRNEAQPGSGKVFVTPITGRRAQDAARAAGLNPAELIGTLRIEGSDRLGLGGRMTRAIADAGINVRGVSAAVIGNKFVAYVGFDSNADADAAAKALKGVKDTAGGGGRRVARSGAAPRRGAAGQAGGRARSRAKPRR